MAVVYYIIQTTFVILKVKELGEKATEQDVETTIVDITDSSILIICIEMMINAHNFILYFSNAIFFYRQQTQESDGKKDDENIPVLKQPLLEPETLQLVKYGLTFQEIKNRIRDDFDFDGNDGFDQKTNFG